MKTTIELPDETFQRAKVLAAQRHTTLKALMREALERFLDDSSGNAEEARKANLTRLLARMQASNTEPMKPLTREEAHAR